VDRTLARWPGCAVLFCLLRKASSMVQVSSSSWGPESAWSLSSRLSWRLAWRKSKALISCRLMVHFTGSLHRPRMMALALLDRRSQVTCASGCKLCHCWIESHGFRGLPLIGSVKYEHHLYSTKMRFKLAQNVTQKSWVQMFWLWYQVYLLCTSHFCHSGCKPDYRPDWNLYVKFVHNDCTCS